MRALFLHDAVFQDKAGGSYMVARQLARGLVERGHEVTFLVARMTPDPPDDEFLEGMRIVRYPGAGEGTKFVREGQAACARLWAEQPFDIVHTHFAYASVGPVRALPPEAVQVRSFYGPWCSEGRVVDRAHQHFLRTTGAASHTRAFTAVKNSLKFTLRRHIESASLKRSRGVIVLSDHSRGEVLSFGYPKEKIHKINGAVDVDRFVPTADRMTARCALGLPKDHRILFTVRRLTSRMGLENLIQAMPSVVQRQPRTLLLIGGTGPECDKLGRLIKATGMTNHIRMIGFIPPNQLALHYQAADLFVLPTVALEGFGLVTVESLACGTPVLGTPVGATPEILEDLEPLLITRGSSPEALSEGIQKFLFGTWALELRAARLRTYVKERYTWDRHVDATLAVYEKVMAEVRQEQESTRPGYFSMRAL